LLARLNDYLNTFPQDSPTDKQDLATSVNGEFCGFALTIHCFKVEKAAIFVTDYGDLGIFTGTRYHSRVDNIIILPKLWVVL
jgi:hypothetical protein